jgi:DNA-binding MarR family transcriptional regulator
VLGRLCGRGGARAEQFDHEVVTGLWTGVGDHMRVQAAADLARRLGFAPQSVGPGDRAGRAGGLVERRAHPVHGRIRQLFPTEAGRAAYQQAATVIAVLERELAQDMDEASATQLCHQLRTLAQQAEALAEQRPGGGQRPGRG